MALRTSLRSTLPLQPSSQRSPGSQLEPQLFIGAQGFGPSSLLRQISPSSPCNNPHKYKQDSADQHPTTSASTIAHPRPEPLSAAPPSTPSQAPKAPLLNPPLRSALPPAAHSPSRGTRLPDSDPIPTTVISPAARSSSKPHNAAPVPNLLHRSIPLSHAAKQSPIAHMPSSTSAVSTAHGFQQQPKHTPSQPQAVTVISHPPVVPKPATQFSSMRHALVGVINGLVAMNCARSGSQLICKREVIVSKILEDAVIKMHMVAIESNESMENAMQKMTPLIISKFQSICSRSSPCPIPNVSHQSFRSPQTSAVPTTSLSSSPQDVTKELKMTSGPTDHHQQRERNMEYTIIVEEGHSLVQRESDLDLKKEWMSCMLKMRELVGKMKERKSA
ncbi:hypothetical protein BWQ96_07237 [Gracilariopsis chorda]|uniref:Uncharacterized protein n=1 Tax=Gracilariopsis chorda TaxID=448386 RepID=A0A2V3IPI3_9FLOR|nr:hypothetical protein BWQ96_07237 [Gracilariopsis chorda]|eukprot:PXF43040.1 hypothetical protein BWQ96_07237 [Gracilariopsis chorda]